MVTLTDKTGAPVVGREDGRFTIAVDGKAVGLTAFADREGQRVFFHTEVDEAFGGRGLATIVIAEALAATRADGLRIVPVCPTVAAYVKKHPEWADIVDRPTKAIMDALGQLPERPVDRLLRGGDPVGGMGTGRGSVIKC